VNTFYKTVNGDAVSITLHSLSEYEANGGEYDDSGNGGEDMRDCKDEFLCAMTIDDPTVLPEQIGVPQGAAWHDDITGYWLLREWPADAPLAVRCNIA
jgi:hypothetical protein